MQMYMKLILLNTYIYVFCLLTIPQWSWRIFKRNKCSSIPMTSTFWLHFLLWQLLVLMCICVSFFFLVLFFNCLFCAAPIECNHYRVGLSVVTFHAQGLQCRGAHYMLKCWGVSVSTFGGQYNKKIWLVLLLAQMLPDLQVTPRQSINEQWAARGSQNWENEAVNCAPSKVEGQVSSSRPGPFRESFW